METFRAMPSFPPAGDILCDIASLRTHFPAISQPHGQEPIGDLARRQRAETATGKYAVTWTSHGPGPRRPPCPQPGATRKERGDGHASCTPPVWGRSHTLAQDEIAITERLFGELQRQFGE